MKYHIAQINIARFKLPSDAPENKDFMDALDDVNERAESSKGFIWRLKGDGNNATDLHPSDDPNLIVNMSVWESLDDLMAFAYRNMEHVAVMRRRKEWFEEISPYLALWWVKSGEIPTIEDGFKALESLKNGPSENGFTFKDRIEAPKS